VPDVTRQQLLVGLVVLAVVAVGIVAWFVFFSDSQSSTLTADSDKFGITLTSRDRAQGSPKAPILMVEYAAPTCPHCAAFDMQIFPLLKRKYIDTGKVYYVFRVFPLNSVDVAAEGIARCLPPENYFSFIDLLYRNQPKWDPEYGVTDVHGGLVQMGGFAGISAQEVDTCIANQPEAAQITQVGQDAQTKYGVNGTPSFIVNGELRVGESTWSDWQDYLNKLLAKK
jgi:protein-disulfide isomerase